MRTYKETLLVFLFLFLLSACEKDSERMDDYLVEFATVEKENSDYRFRLDNGRLLIPEGEINYSAEPGQRVILNYVPLEGNTIKINNISNIHTDKIEEEGYPERYSSDPVKIQSVWVVGNYLNMIMETEYHSIPHIVKLFRDNSSTSINIHFSHSSNNDPPGYPIMMYASFLLTSLRETGDDSPIPFKLFINTYTGMRTFEMELQ